jgi:hypothetical protein
MSALHGLHNIFLNPYKLNYTRWNGTAITTSAWEYQHKHILPNNRSTKKGYSTKGIACTVFSRNFKGLCNVAQVKNFWEFLCWTIKSMTMFLSYAQCNKMSSWNGLYILFVSIYPGKCDLSNENKLKDVNWVKKQSVKKKNVLNYGYKPINSPPFHLNCCSSYLAFVKT